MAHHETKGVARQRADAQLTLVARRLEDLDPFQRKAAQIGHRIARNTETERLLGHRMAVFHSCIAHIALMHAEELRQRFRHKTGISAGFTNAHQQMLPFAVGAVTEILHHDEIFGVRFDHAARGRLAVQKSLVLQRHAASAFSSSATASQAMPSPRPVKPSFSVVVALTLT